MHLINCGMSIDVANLPKAYLGTHVLRMIVVGSYHTCSKPRGYIVVLKAVILAIIILVTAENGVNASMLGTCRLCISLVLPACAP
jgi:hypothetical protein